MNTNRLMCRFRATDAAGVYRCPRCGFVTLPTRFPPERVHRECRWHDLATPAFRATPPCPYRGMGDMVAAVLKRLSFGRLRPDDERCGCRARQSWLNDRFPVRWLVRRLCARDAAVRTSSAVNVLLVFPHGFGDAVQFTVVLRHLKQFRPDWNVDVACQFGAHSLFQGLARRTYITNRATEAGPDLASYDLVKTLAWSEPNACHDDSPSTKAERCLREVFRMRPDAKLARYYAPPDDGRRSAAAGYLGEIAGAPGADGRFPVVVLHYQGNSARRGKNLDEQIVRRLVGEIQNRGLTPVILDFETPPRSAIVRESCVRESCVRERWPGVHSPGVMHPLWRGEGTGDGATLAALIGQARLFVGIDSGPGHVAGATDTPSIIVWTKHHPLHYYGLSPNVTHLAPVNHREFLRAGREAGVRFFDEHYNYRVYRDLGRSLTRLAEEMLGGAGDAGRNDLDGFIVDGDLWVRGAFRRADMVIVRDVYLEDCYRIGELRARPKTILDVGAHIGAFAARAHQRWPRARIVAVEANAANLPCLRANTESFARLEHAALSYEPGPLALMSTVFEGSRNTGGSFVTARPPPVEDPRYRREAAVSTLTLEAVLEQCNWPRVDLLKLDCEGCEFSLLENTPSLSRIGTIVGEFHDRARFEYLVRTRFAGWRLRMLRDEEPGTFWLVNVTNQ